MDRVHVKICCIQSVEEAALALELGADALGLVSAMPSGPGVISEAEIARITAALPEADTFLLTRLQDVEALAAQQQRTGVRTVQLCDRLPDGAVQELRRRLPHVRWVPVIHIAGETSVAEAVAAAVGAHALLLDSGRPSAPVPELGGTGRTHDWEVSARIRTAVSVPVYLAGGLNPANVGAAIRRVRPFGVDVCSGVRVQGRLDRELLTRFMAAVREAE